MHRHATQHGTKDMLDTSTPHPFAQRLPLAAPLLSYNCAHVRVRPCPREQLRAMMVTLLNMLHTLNCTYFGGWAGATSSPSTSAFCDRLRRQAHEQRRQLSRQARAWRSVHEHVIPTFAFREPKRSYFRASAPERAQRRRTRPPRQTPDVGAGQMALGATPCANVRSTLATTKIPPGALWRRSAGARHAHVYSPWRAKHNHLGDRLASTERMHAWVSRAGVRARTRVSVRAPTRVRVCVCVRWHCGNAIGAGRAQLHACPPQARAETPATGASRDARRGSKPNHRRGNWPRWQGRPLGRVTVAEASPEVRIMHAIEDAPHETTPFCICRLLGDMLTSVFV